jgi:hypothetical protein
MDTHFFLQDAHGAYYAINGPTTIGRDPGCQIRLSDPEVSRNHALLWIDRRNLYIRDEDTRNGTFLNEFRLPASQAIALAVGSQLRLGDTSFTVVSLAPAEAQTPPTIQVQSPLAPPTQPNRLPIYIILLLGVLCLGALILAAGYLFLTSRPSALTTSSAAQSFPVMAILAISARQPLLSPHESADENCNSALAVAKRNNPTHVFITSDYFQSYGDPRPYLERIAAAGFTHIHWCHQWNTDFLYSTSEIDQIESWFADYGLHLLNLHASQGKEKYWCSLQEYQRKAGVELVQNRIHMAARMCSSSIRHPMPMQKPRKN